MANRIQVSESITILELFASGWPKLRIARELDLDVKTVRRCIREAAAANSKSYFRPPAPPVRWIQKGQFRPPAIHWETRKFRLLGRVQNPYFCPPGKTGGQAAANRTGNGSRMPLKAPHGTAHLPGPGGRWVCWCL